MRKVLEFLIRNINLIIFLVLESLCFILIFTNNPYQSASFFNSSNELAGIVLEESNNVKEYLSLKKTNEDLARENARLRFLLTKKYIREDISFNPNGDTSYQDKYSFIPAKVINNSTDNVHNYLTINKGLVDSIKPGMGVVYPNGIVGKVKSCSRNFSTITSVLHTDMLISCKIKKINVTGSLRWEGIDPTRAKLMYVARHIKVAKGDTIITSEFNSVFPEGEMVGIIDEIKIKGDESFYNIVVKLSTDFTALNYVYVVNNKMAVQQDSLQKLNLNEKNESK